MRSPAPTFAGPVRARLCAAWMVALLLPRVVLAQAQPLAAAAAADAPLTLGAAIERALTANPAAGAARLRQAIAAAGVDVARQRTNPDVRVEIERETPHEAFSIGLPIETGGKRGQRIAVGQAAVRTNAAELTQTLIGIRTAVRLAYVTRLIAEARLTLQRELVGLAARVRDAARARFDAGGVPRLEVVQAQLALSEAENQQTAVEGQEVAARAQLNALLALPLDAAIPLATPLDAIGAPPLAPALDIARSTSSELAVLDRRIDEEHARIALARAMQKPDVTPEVSITHGNAPEFNIGWRAAVGIAIPVFSTHRADVVLEQTTLTQLTAERDATLARITGDVTAAFAVANAQHTQYIRYRDQIVPQALEVERMADDSYRLGQTGIAAYLQALQTTRDTRLRALQAAADFQTALSDMERAMGAPLP